MAGGLSHIVMLVEGGTVVTWGYGPYGQLGIESQFNFAAPRIISSREVFVSGGLCRTAANAVFPEPYFFFLSLSFFLSFFLFFI